jgi:hypothetical protein
MVSALRSTEAGGCTCTAVEGATREMLAAERLVLAARKEKKGPREASMAEPEAPAAVPLDPVLAGAAAAAATTSDTVAVTLRARL